MTKTDITHPSDDNEHADVIALLDEAGRRERNDLAQAQSADALAGPAEESFARELRESARRTSRAPRRRMVLAAAAALVVTSLAAWQWGANSDKSSGDTLLGDAVRLVGPLGAVATFEHFVFEAELEGDVFAIIRVYDDAAEGFEALTESGRLRESQWTPDVDTSSWSAIRWTVTVYEGTAQAESIAGPVEARATRDS